MRELQPEEQAYVLEYYKTHSNRDIEKTLGITHRELIRFLKDKGLYVYKPRYSLCNDKYFDVIDDEHKAYWLGFIFADGYLSAPPSRPNSQPRVGIALQAGDGYLLEQFKKDIAFSGEVKYYYTGKSSFKISQYGRIIITSSTLVNSLLRCGCKYHKSLGIEFPSEDVLEQSLIRHFIRGYFDGDGGLSGFLCHDKNYNLDYWKYTLSFTGTKEMLDAIKHHLGKDSLKLMKRYNDKKNNHTLNICGNHQIVNILDWLYEDATIYMLRKHDKYQLIKALVG